MTAMPSAATTGAVLSDQIRSELIKICSVRPLRWLPVLAVLIAPVLALVVGLTGSLEPDDTVTGAALTGVSVALAVVGSWGALVVTTEFGSGTIRPVLVATPQRRIVLAAKTIVVALVATLVGVLSPTLAYLVGVAVIDTAKYTAGQFFPGIIGICGCFPTVATLGLAAGVVVRNSAAAVALMGAHLVLPQMTAAQAVGDLHKWMTLIAPSAVVAKLSGSSDAAPEIMGTVGGWPRLALVVVGAIGALAAARRMLDRADA
ncbi:ABC transporter permease [Nocardia sp. CDC159]|uniref:ABC transporter permease n=1 Tax=Nocardia pulmonis TaxID=2951408 RepID=A0A9X2EGP0_9NOCA|nr:MULTISPECIES: ABC transporter permease [Nocardia]MCM6778398.1 ABC transporter permease [Nocardia pulmonis]MCM6791206.1 ABC transporter permease [Nocardia sp. CDC159]